MQNTTDNLVDEIAEVEERIAIAQSTLDLSRRDFPNDVNYNLLLDEMQRVLDARKRNVRNAKAILSVLDD